MLRPSLPSFLYSEYLSAVRWLYLKVRELSAAKRVLFGAIPRVGVEGAFPKDRRSVPIVSWAAFLKCRWSVPEGSSLAHLMFLKCRRRLSRGRLMHRNESISRCPVANCFNLLEGWGVGLEDKRATRHIGNVEVGDDGFVHDCWRFLERRGGKTLREGEILPRSRFRLRSNESLVFA
jgi:hypothetical protein